MKQTKTYLRARLREIGIEPDTRHGQNFLIDPNLQQLIVDAAQLTPDDVVLEVGTGTGSLTTLMAPHVASVVGVELDAHLYELASEVLLDFENVLLLRADALKNKNRLNPDLVGAVRTQLEVGENRQLKLVANLPYNIATPVLSNLLMEEPLPVSMTATIQKELAERIVAPPWSKDYSALSVWIQSQCDAEILRVLPPSVFWPAPKVHSAIIRIQVDRQRRAQIPDLQYFHQFVKAIFLHRRKLIRANVISAMKRHLTKAEVDALLGEMQFDPDTRTEQLDVQTLFRFAEKVRAQAPDWHL